MAYKPRTTAPTYEDYKQINRAYPNGLNNAIVINGSSGSVLPNCTGYVHFRAIELCGDAVEDKLCLNNAVAYYGYTKDGLERGQTPKLGAIAVWSGGSKGYGHVAVVEAIYSDGSILTSNSNYSGTRFYTMRIAKPYVPWSGYKLLGFIYLPWDKGTEYYGTPVERDSSKYQVEIVSKILRARKRPEMSDEVILGLMNAGKYNVVETRDMTSEASNGYFWYSPAPDLWFARKDGEWTNDLPAEDADALREQVKELTAEVASLEGTITDLRTRCDSYRSALTTAADAANAALKQ